MNQNGNANHKIINTYGKEAKIIPLILIFSLLFVIFLIMAIVLGSNNK
jgi:hypothetical protein